METSHTSVFTWHDTARAGTLLYPSTVSSSGLLLHHELPPHPVTLLRNTSLRTRQAIWSGGEGKVRRMQEQKKPPKGGGGGAFLMTLWMTAALLTLKQIVRSKQRKYNLYTFFSFCLWPNLEKVGPT